MRTAAENGRSRKIQGKPCEKIEGKPYEVVASTPHPPPTHLPVSWRVNGGFTDKKTKFLSPKTGFRLHLLS